MADRSVKAGERVMVRGPAIPGQTYVKLPDVYLGPSQTAVTVTFSADPEPPPPPEPPPAPGTVKGVWISPAELAKRPMTGAAWQSVLTAAGVASSSGAALSDMTSDHDSATLAAAIVAVRTGGASWRDKALAALNGIIGTEGNQRWLDICRNLGAYIAAADLLDVRSGPVFDYLKTYRTRKQPHNNTGVPETLHDNAWSSSSNASAHAGFVHAALMVYLGDTAELKWGWDGFRRYAGDRTSPHKMNSNNDTWQQIPADPVGIQNKGATKGGCRLDGAIANDMIRGGSSICNPGHTNYPWVGLNGSVPAALVLARAGFPAWTVSDSAMRRAGEYLVSLGTSWFPGTNRTAHIGHVLNVAYGINLPSSKPLGIGETFGFTDYTHPDAASVGR